MLNVNKFDDINDLEINNKEGEMILNRFYNHNANVIKDKYGLLKTVAAIIQFEDYSFGVVLEDYTNKNHTIIYGVKFDNTIYETDIKALLSFNIIDNGIINSSDIMHYNLSCCADKRSIKRVFTLEGYSEF